MSAAPDTEWTDLGRGVTYDSSCDWYDDKSLVKLFISSFASIRDSFVDHVAKDKYKFSDLGHYKYADRLKEMLDYTTAGGKMWRGTMVVRTARDVCTPEQFTDQVKREALILGWCTELLQACFLVADDIMDGSSSRRGQPCWYKVETVQLDAINDSLILESVIYFLLKKHFRDSKNYVRFLEFFHEVSLQTQLGQMADTLSEPKGTDPNLDHFSEEVHRRIIIFKTAYYTFYLPLASGLIISGLDSDEVLAKCEKISKALGEKFQIQDDYLDCFGTFEVLGKDGTDIQDHKCSWLVVKALEMARGQTSAETLEHLKSEGVEPPSAEEIMETLKNNYGPKGTPEEVNEKVETIKQLYRNLGLPEVYKLYNAKSYDAIEAMLSDGELPLPAKPFESILAKLRKRDK